MNDLIFKTKDGIYLQVTQNISNCLNNEEEKELFEKLDKRGKFDLINKKKLTYDCVVKDAKESIVRSSKRVSFE